MKKFVLTVLALVAVAAPAMGQTGDISTYADQAGTSCSVTDVAGPVTVYLIHKHTGGATASQFAVTSSGGMTMTSFGFTEQPEVLKIGTVADLSLAYTGCRVGDFYLGSILYFGAGTSTPCARMTLSPAPTSPIPGEVAMVDCVNDFLVPATGQAIVNPNGTCQCDVGVRESTWGSIKALYQ